MPLQITEKTIPLRGLSLSVDDVLRIIERLTPHIDEEGQREVAQLLETDPNSSDRRQQLEFQREQAFRITVTIDGRDGESLFGYGAEPLNSPNIPEPIETIYISNNAAYQTVAGRNPVNSFTLHLDFSTPRLVDNNNPASDPTPNLSNLTVKGERDAWVASIQKSVMDVLDKRLNRRRFLHAAFIYDIGLMLFGLPAAFYLCWRLSEFVESSLGVNSAFMSAAAYVYIVFLTLNVYRVLFGYTKWAFPAVELTSNENRSSRHRKSWFTIVLSIIASAISDLLW